VRCRQVSGSVLAYWSVRRPRKVAPRCWGMGVELGGAGTVGTLRMK